MLKYVIAMDFELNGYWEGLKLQKRLITQGIPRLLDALVQGGRSIKAGLIHGDFWEGSCETAIDNGQMYIFDAAAFYAHHEMEVGDWRCNYNKSMTS